ncbi:MAG: hypothetical protein IT480_07700, partial [Gammaproteobacteria bacterium]|nr:hypothetical protein [Gammaproteobacteria bacterium]
MNSTRITAVLGAGMVCAWLWTAGSALSLAADENAAVPHTMAEHSAEAARYREEAAALEAKAAKHAKLAQGYSTRG